MRVLWDATLGIEQTQSGCRNNSLFQRALCVATRGIEIAGSVGDVTKRARGQPRKLASMTVSKWDHDAIRRKISEPREWISGEAWFALLAIRNDGRTTSFETRNGVA